MGPTEIRLLVSIVMLGSVMSRSHFHNSTDTDGGKKSYTHPLKRQCPTVTIQKYSTCLARATSTDSRDDDHDDLDFFKQCIVDYFCFKKATGVTAWATLPNFLGQVGTRYFNSVAKRVGHFFIRNNEWSRTLVNPKFRDSFKGECTKLLHVTAARYLYVIYVLNLLRDRMTFGPCKTKNYKLIVPSRGVCFPVPSDTVTCTSDFDIALLGARSGSLAALFNQFFREPLGTDPIVAGFGKSAEEIFDTNVHAFTLEYAMPTIFAGLTHSFQKNVKLMNAHIKYKVQEVVSAILKMHTYNHKYYNDLMSDQVELRSMPTKNKLNVVFHDWTVQFQNFNDAVKSLMGSDQFSTIVSFRHKQNIAYEMITGVIEASGLPDPAGKALAQNAIALMYASEAYHTRGTIRHVVGVTQMKRGAVARVMSNNDYWVSMLENWADSVKEYNRECVKQGLAVAVCLPRMSKYLWRMLDAMYKVRLRLPRDLQRNLVDVDKKRSGARAIVANWLNNVKRKGLHAIPQNEATLNAGQSNLDVFLKTFQCPRLNRYDPLTQGCMDAIQAEIRKYNRRLFLDLVKMDPPS